MITYSKGAYGLNLLSRVHGSAVYKAVAPGILSVGFYLSILRLYDNYGGVDQDIDHPYVVGVLVTSVSFLIIFRANNSYQRYWEACGAVHHMMSKFLDATVHMASFHMQCSHYDHIRPPSFYDHPELLQYNLSRDRVRPIVDINNNFDAATMRSSVSINPVSEKYANKMKKSRFVAPPQDFIDDGANDGATPLLAAGRIDGGWNKLLDHKNNEEMEELDFERRNASNAFGDTPSLFLKELAHLSSLLVAVAFSTLRNDEEGSESPLGTYIPGSEWPAPDPDKMSAEEKAKMKTTMFQSISYWLGFDRTPEYRTMYNASRPMLVIGGVSEGELKQLQRARGASAKTTLAWYWLSEFIGREHLAGSSGNVGPPIISRLFQFLSDGMIYYNHGRKIMFIPFPFPHAQLSAIFVLVMVLAVPFMMTQFANEWWLGCILTFLLVTCLAGLHEVGRELENPYRNTPNEVPLCTLLAMYNEALISMCSGYHPDGYWDEGLGRRKGEPEVVKAVQLKEKEIKRSSEDDKKAAEELSELRTTVEKQAIELQELRALFEDANLEKSKVG